MNPDVLDDALERLAGTAPEFGPGLSNHGPMAAEALVHMRVPESVPAFADRYRRRLDPAPAPGRPLAADEWGAAIGSFDRYPDLLALFDAELADRAVSVVVAEWVPRLAPGTIGAAGHGLIRTAHARRSLAVADTALRRHELAQGLAYWAARYLELPGPPILIGGGTLEAQLAALPHLEDDDDEVLITDRVGRLDAVAGPFEAVVVGLAAPPDPRLTLDALGAAGAGAYMRNAESGDVIALVHAVTLPMALELLLDDLRPEDRQGAFSYAWQAAAALHAAYATDRQPLGVTDLLADAPYPEELVAAAVASGDEHAIKMTEACLRAFRRTGEPVLLAAAVDASRRLG